MKFSGSIVMLFLALCCAGVEPIDWQKAKKLQPGIEYLEITAEKPRLMKLHFMRIDLTLPGLHFTTTPRDPDWGKPMPDYPKYMIRTKRVSTIDFMTEAREKGGNMVVAVNGTSFRPWVKPFNHKYAEPKGINILNGEVVSDVRPHKAVFWVDKAGKIGMSRGLKEEDYSKMAVAVSGFAVILEDGKDCSGTVTDVHPRLSYGLSKDRRYLYLLAVDGRQPGWSIGAALQDLTAYMIAAGASDALNMDGGGSTSMVWWDPAQKKPVMFNRHEGGMIRKVSCSLGILLPAEEK